MNSDEDDVFSDATDSAYDPDGADVALDLVTQLASILPPPSIGPRGKKPPRPLRRSGDLQAVGDVVSQVASDQGWQSKISLHVLKVRWPELAGDVNAQHSQPVALDGAIVQVTADSSTWASALKLIAPQLVAKINQALGDGSVSAVTIKGPDAPTWKHGIRAVRDGRGPRDTYG